MTEATASLELRFLIALLLLSAALPKLRHGDDFRNAVASYRLLPDRLVAPFATWLPRAELVVGTVLLVGFFPRLAAALAAAMLLLFAAAIAVNLARGRVIDCGCMSSSAPRRITWRLVFVDVALAAGATAVAVAPSTTWTIVDLGQPAGAAVAHSDAAALLVTAAGAVLVARLVREWLRVRELAERVSRPEAAA